MEKDRQYLECEKKWIYRVLIIVAGFYGAYSMALRGGVFSNAQTGNVVLMAMAFGNGHWLQGAYYLIPISAYALGGFVSELLPAPIQKSRLIRWDTLLVLFEIVMVILMGFIPATAPHQICQVIINFICSMQYNTFRQAEGVSMATTFCTNHIRQLGMILAWRVTGKKTAAQTKSRFWIHVVMVFCFAVGVVAGTLACRYLGVRAIWLNLIPLVVVFVDLLHADRTKEKELLEITPSGH